MKNSSEVLSDSLGLLQEDAESAKLQWTGGTPFKSLPQRSGKSFDELVSVFDASPAESEWCYEYGSAGRSPVLRVLRRRMAFQKASLKEFREEYDDGVTDVDFMRLLEVPFTDSEYVVAYGMEDMGDVQ